MSLRLIIGRAGTGKTVYCMKDIVVKQKSSGRLILIVPEQYSSQAERDLIAATKERGILTAEVLSFGRLAHHILQKQGLFNRQALGDTGKAMAIRKILLDLGDRLLFFKKAIDRQGFVEQLCLSVTELCQYCITGEALLARSKSSAFRPAMQEKLQDLSLIYTAYTDFVKERYFSGDTLLDILSVQLANTQLLEDTEIWIDGFYGFTPQEYQTIAHLLRLCKRVSITLTMEDQAMMERSLMTASSPTASSPTASSPTASSPTASSPTAPFFEAYVTKYKLLNLAEKEGVSVEVPLHFEENHRSHTAGLRFLEQNFLKHFGKSSRNCEGVRIIKAKNRDWEIRRIAMEIIGLVRDKGLRYRDLAVVTNAMNDYEKSLCGILKEFGIPYFIDRKKEIISHPLVTLLCSLMDLFVHNFQYEAMFGYLKTGLGPLSRAQTDRLENYALASGIKSYSWFSEDRWKLGVLHGDEEEFLLIKECRDSALKPLLDFREAFDSSKTYTAAEIAKGLLHILDNLDIENKLKEQADECNNNKKEGRAREHAQIYKIVWELLEKLIEILGNEKMTLSAFQKILEAGIQNSSLGIIPPTADSLLVGDLERTRLPEVSTLFVLGVNEGYLPSVDGNVGIWTDKERSLLESGGINLGGDGKSKAFLEQYIIYLSFSKPKDSLILSYCAADLEGKKMRPSGIISRLQHLFPTLLEDGEDKPALFSICNTTACMHQLGEEMYCKAKENTEMPSVWQDIYTYFFENGDFQKKLLTLRAGLVADAKNEKLSQPLLNKLYAGDMYSNISQLEHYASCPFSYFAKYNLKASERQLYELRLPDLGLLFHTVLECFAKLLTEEGRNWFSLTKGEAEELIELAVDEAAPQLGNQILFNTAANRYLIKRVKRIIKRGAWTLTEHVQMGDFRPVGFELGFGQGEAMPPIAIALTDGRKLILRGKIDRIDIMDSDKKSYVKIIDYKSGSKEFNFQDIFYGLQLQLLIYLDAYLKTGSQNGKLCPGGLFYFQVKDKAITITKDMTAEEIYTLLFRDMRMSGLALSKPQVIVGMDHSFTFNTRGGLTKGSSAIIPVAVNTDGSFAKGRARVADEVQYDALMNFAVIKAKEAGEAICRGEIAPYPTNKAGSSPCRYCEYASLCGFTGENFLDYHILSDMDDEAFWAALEQVPKTKD